MTNELLLKYVKGESSAEEDLEVIRWIEADEQNRIDYEQLRHIYDALLCQECIPVSNGRSWQQIILRVAGVAALLFLVAFAGYSLRPVTGKAHDTCAAAPRNIYVPVGQRAEICLDDGTRVWLNSNSSLTMVPANSHQRHVQLQGEAYFDVASDEKKPFIVSVGRREIRVLGTSFEVSSADGGARLAMKLFSGKVALADSITGKTHALTPGQKIEMSHDGTILHNMTPADTTLLWIDGIYHFANSDFGTVFRSLAERFHLTVEVKDPRVLNYHVTCKFRIEDGFEHVIRGLQLIHPFESDWNENERILTIR